ncbi:Mur ligase family protein [bacterium]|nr:Mur ligase family protein [bacterium]
MKTKHKLLNWLDKKSESRFIFGLERMHQALNFFNVQHNSTCVQILGTNGKGSSIEFLKNILISHNKSVAVYTSPHLFSLYDRFKINDQNIAEDLFLNYLSRLFDAEKNQQIPKLSYFEITTLLAYLYFSESNVDYMLIEAGLGGRLDATTALGYSHLMFTSVDYDHQAYLGNSLQAIAYEKFSVIKHQHQVFSLDQNTEALLVLKKIIKQTQANLHLENQDFSLQQNKNTVSYALEDDLLIKPIHLSLQGDHQLHNALLASQVAHGLLKNNFNPEKTKLALKNTQKAGRYQKTMCDQTTFIFDVAHNQQSFMSLMKTSKTHDPDIDAYCLSMLADKPWQSVLNTLLKDKKPIFLCMTESTRAWDYNTVMDWVKSKDKENLIVFYEDYTAALKDIKKQFKKCLIFGSFFFVGPCIQFITSIKK